MPGSLRELPSATVRASPMAPSPSGNAKRGLFIATVAGIFMACVGALGTGNAPLLHRLAYWLLVMETGALIGIGASAGVNGWGRLRERPVREGALIAALIAVPLSIVVASATVFFFGGRFPGAVGFIAIVGIVFAISSIITAINYTTAPAAPIVIVVGDPSHAIPPAPPLRFMERLPLRLRGSRLVAIEAEDHYLRVHTDAGSDLILMRMSDAIAELGEVRGARTHRSWWVARDAVLASDSRTMLKLTGGLDVPVSRNSRAALVADGWFAA